LQRGRKAVYWPVRSSLVKSEPECRYAAFTKINYLIIKLLKIKNNGKITDILITA
jgi:predicted metal-binding protein